MEPENKSPNTSRNGVIIEIGDMIQECDAGYIGRVTAVDGGAMLYRPFGGQEISDPSYANCDECIVLTEPEMPIGHGINENAVNEYKARHNSLPLLTPKNAPSGIPVREIMRRR